MKKRKFYPTWSQEEKDFIIRYYNDFTIRELHEKYFLHRTYDAFRIMANSLGFKKTEFHTKDENFFEIPNLINSSVAGMLASDSNLHKHKNKNSYSFALEINQEDEKILDDIKLAMNYSGRLYHRQRKYKIYCKKNGKTYEGESYRSNLRVTSQKYIEDLYKNWNIPTGKKSLILEPPKNLQNLDIKLAYFCGLINGDGCVGLQTINKGRRKHLEICVYGTYGLTAWCREICEEFLGYELDIKINTHNDRNTLYRFRLTGFKAILLFDKIRSLNCIKMDRKWNSPEILDYIRNRKLDKPELFYLIT